MNSEFIKFCKRFSVFFLLIFIFVIAINWFYANYVIKKQQYYRQELAYQNYIKSLPQDKKIDYGFFGDSHARNGVDPHYTLGAFNFGTSAENYIETYYKLEKIINTDKVKIDTAVFEIDLITFSSVLTDNTRIFDDIYYYHKYVSFQEIKKIKNASNLEMAKAYLSQVYFPAIGKGEDFINLFVEPKLTEVYLGWTKEYNNYSLTDTAESAAETFNQQFENRERISKISLDYFLKTLELAEENGIDIVFIKYPISKELNDVIKEKNFEINDYYKNVFGEIDKKTNKNHLVLDYYDIFFDHSDYFTNPDHLNYKGAEILSKKINEDIKNYKESLCSKKTN